MRRFGSSRLPSEADLGVAAMPIPHAEHLHVSQAKLHGYLLDPDHPFGEAKARWFASQGFHRGNSDRLADDLIELARHRSDRSPAHHGLPKKGARLMTTKEHEIVALVPGLPEHGLQAGDIGTVRDVRGDGAEFEVEVMTGDGRTVGVFTLGASDIRKLDGSEILHARRVSA